MHTPLMHYLHDTSNNPQNCYNILSNNPDLLTQQNVTTLENHLQDMQKEQNVPLSAIFFVHFKYVVLKMCMEYGIDPFFESLQSEPPDEVALRFQDTLTSFRAQLTAANR